MTKKLKQLDNVSLTAYRVIAILLMLKERPHTEVEINERLKDSIASSRVLSRDSIWLYINTLKVLGCNITRPTKNNGYKYILKDHPFNLHLTELELKSLLEVRKYISSISDWQLSCNYDKFLSTLCKLLPESDKKILTEYCKSNFREINYTLKQDLIAELEYYCSNNDCILIVYNSLSGKSTEIKLFAEKLKYENGALYIWGYNATLEEYQYLRVDRIDSVAKTDLQDVTLNKTSVDVIFKLYGIHIVSYNPEEDEEVLSRNADSIVIKHKLKNKFKLIQKILSFGRDCEILEPRQLQKDLIKKLKLMKKNYKEI